MNGVAICQSIMETVRELIHSEIFLNAYRIGNAFIRKKEIGVFGHGTAPVELIKEVHVHFH